MADWLSNTLWMVGLIIVGSLVAVRVAPTDPEVWHVDPLTAASPAPGGVVARPEDGDLSVPTLTAPSGEVLRRLDAIITATPRTKRIAGDVASGRITYMTRSLIFGFPDFATVTVVPVEGGSAPVILSRLRFGVSDTGVNARRVQGWLDALVAAPT